MKWENKFNISNYFARIANLKWGLNLDSVTEEDVCLKILENIPKPFIRDTPEQEQKRKDWKTLVKIRRDLETLAASMSQDTPELSTDPNLFSTGSKEKDTLSHVDYSKILKIQGLPQKPWNVLKAPF